MPKSVINYSSPYDATSLITFLADPVTQCTCWKLTPSADSILTNAIGATSHTRDLVLPGHSNTFRRIGGIEPTAVDTESGSESAGLTFQAVFDDAAITKVQIGAGDWDGAKLEIYSLNYKALKMGQLIEFSGKIGGFSEEGQLFSAEARHLTAIARLKVGRRASANCDARRFGDARCQRDLTDVTHTGKTVTTGASQVTFRASALAASIVFTMENGEIHFTSGENAGRIGIVRTWDAGTGEITLQRAMPYLIAVGNTFTAIEGCGRTQQDCEDRDNIENYQGLPFITNIEKFNQIIRAA